VAVLGVVSGARAPHRRAARPLRLVVLIVTVTVAGLAFGRYHRQTVSYLTHWKGSPSETAAYVPFPAEDPPQWRLAVVGDIGDSGRQLEATAAAIGRIGARDPFDALLLLGDNVYPSGDPARLDDVVFKPFGPILARGAALLAILGNHDVKAGHGPAQMAALGMPTRWWSVERNGVLLVGLDSNTPDEPEQLAWLEHTLRANPARWKIVALHHPPYSAGYQGSNRAARAAFSPLFERYGVALVLSGHDHDYQRSVVIQGVTYVVTGGAAGARRTSEADFTAVSFSWHSYVELGVYPDRIVGRALNQADRVADEWVLSPPGGRLTPG
jgi:3',5'-cyclic AMP phosphodiesterase CpdA